LFGDYENLDVTVSKATVIDIRGLRVERESVILAKIDWRVEAGQHWVILGANGSGKTSLLSTMTGYLPLTDGTISVLGETYGKTDWRDLRMRIGIVSSAIQQLMPANETALDAVISGKRAMIGLWGDTATDERSRAFEILRQTEATQIEDRQWRFLSQGERQRVLIGRALMAKPELLILDEPCAGLDPVAREQFLQFIERLSHDTDAPSLVLVTHHVEEIMPGFSHVLILKSGRVLASGSKDRVMSAEKLSEAFGATLRLTQVANRYSLAVVGDASKVV
jgi:iron complex transport system ATP-binding protein